jgi:hypothetical protein
MIGVVNVTLIDTTVQAIYDWMNGAHAHMTDWLNTTCFDEFVKNNSALIAWQREVENGTIDYEYSPTDVVTVDQLNMNLVLSNYGSNPVLLKYTGSAKSSVAPAAKGLTLPEFAIPSGAAMTLPWLNELARARRKFQHAQRRVSSCF